jgi:hypothetical protein
MEKEEKKKGEAMELTVFFFRKQMRCEKLFVRDLEIEVAARVLGIHG